MFLFEADFAFEFPRRENPFTMREKLRMFFRQVCLRIKFEQMLSLILILIEK